jgi:membrane fusion protein, multidrug efflux system
LEKNFQLSPNNTEADPQTIKRSLALSLYTKRQTLLMYLLASILLMLAAYLGYWFFYGSRYISTNNAYVAAEIAKVSAPIEGLVNAIDVSDTQLVQKGDLLVQIDDQEIKLKLKQAKARLLKAEADLERSQLNYQRRKSLAPSSVISEEDLSDSENAIKVAKAHLQEALALQDLAELNERRTYIYAPIEGIVVQRQVQLGQRVLVGDPLLSIVPLYDSYVNANFKENQLRQIKTGQRVTLTADKYGPGLKFQGKIQGLSGGTGSFFALIPAQNATGNWIKVVQRVPVRIALDPEALRKMPLEMGLSMHVKIHLSNKE